MFTTTLGAVKPGNKFWFPSDLGTQMVKGANNKYRRVDRQTPKAGGQMIWLTGSSGVEVLVARKPKGAR